MSRQFQTIALHKRYASVTQALQCNGIYRLILVENRSGETVIIKSKTRRDEQ